MCGGLTFNSVQSERGRPRATTDAIPLPQPKPRAMREHFVVSSIRRREVARAQRPRVWLREDSLKPLDFGNNLLGVHSDLISDMEVAIVKRSGMLNGARAIRLN